jgi:hypothetical protein
MAIDAVIKARHLSRKLCVSEQQSDQMCHFAQCRTLTYILSISIVLVSVIAVELVICGDQLPRVIIIVVFVSI